MRHRTETSPTKATGPLAFLVAAAWAFTACSSSPDDGQRFELQAADGENTAQQLEAPTDRTMRIEIDAGTDAATTIAGDGSGPESDSSTGANHEGSTSTSEMLDGSATSDEPDSSAASGEAGGVVATTTPTTVASTAPSKATTSSTRPTTDVDRQGAEGSNARYFKTLPVGATLPTGEWCAQHVKPAAETRPMNSRYNATRGVGNHDLYPRVDGNYTGTTDEILQWAACKWGIDEDIVRAQATIESWWDMANWGDVTSNQERCHKDLRTDEGRCPESIGILQIKYRFHSEAYENGNAFRSTAYNADYVYARWRDCFEGNIEWLNDIERGRRYAAGDAEGCLGAWFSGHWYAKGAADYIARLNDTEDRRLWETYEFLQYEGD